ncbi:MAG TPA: FHA domain-containing protein [Longimicrobium sp.]|nr:FHA domain-containing protein [Longimicrobium sp.]
MRSPGLSRALAALAFAASLCVGGALSAQDSARTAPPPSLGYAPVPVGPAPLTPTQQEDKRKYLGRARAASRDLTTAAVQERMDLWAMVRIADPSDVEAQMEFDRARADLETARAQETAQKQQQDAALQAQAAQAADRREKLGLAERALYARDLNSAEQIVTGVLAQSPDDPRALSLRDAIRQAHEARRFTRRMLLAAGAMLAVAVAIVVLVKRLSPKGGPGGREEAGAPKAVVKVIDGVGRGRLLQIEKDIFRIGAADGERPDEKNDLVISDAAAQVSRYHCSILRKGRDYFLIDASLNGTRLNDRQLARGEHHPLEDGDEFVVAGAARLKFLHT